MSDDQWKEGYLVLSPRAAIKVLEEPYVYLVDRDELFEINDEAFGFLSRCDGSHRGLSLTDDGEFVAYCLTEGIIEIRPGPSSLPVREARSPIPSLRFLELQLTSRCNLKCLHCYQGTPAPVDMPIETALAITDQFEAMAGLKLLISGGEPMLYPHIFEFLNKTAGLPIRRVLITNGTLLDREKAARLGIDEVQVSLDGWERGHESIRGTGSFAAVMRGIQAAKSEGIAVSIATMVHRGNLDEFDRIAAFIDEIDATAWGIDVPCTAGRQKVNPHPAVTPAEAAPLLRYAFGGGAHSAAGFACGHHLMTVLPSGIGVKCGFYADQPLGDAGRSLAQCRERITQIRVEELRCAGCPYLSECGGGCRFRAPGPLDPDPMMCALFGVRGPQEDTP